jgi:hypothetical protein
VHHHGCSGVKSIIEGENFSLLPSAPLVDKGMAAVRVCVCVCVPTALPLSRVFQGIVTLTPPAREVRGECPKCPPFAWGWLKHLPMVTHRYRCAALTLGSPMPYDLSSAPLPRTNTATPVLRGDRSSKMEGHTANFGHGWWEGKAMTSRQ